MKKLSCAAPILAAVLVLGSSFISHKVSTPTQYLDGGVLKPIEGPYICETPPFEVPCTYGDDNLPSGEVGNFIRLW